MPRTIAVIGSGMAGLAAARLFHDAGDDVTVFEALSARGMDAHTLDIDGGRVDVPLRVMSPHAWRHVLALAGHVGIDTFPVDTYASCSWMDGTTWLRSGRMPVTGWPGITRWRDLSLQNVRAGWGLVQLAHALRQLDDDALTLRVWLERQHFHPDFWRGLALPLLTTICTCAEEHLLAWPARPLLQLLSTILHGDRLRRLCGGTPALVEALAAPLRMVSGSPVVRATPVRDGIDVCNAKGEGGHYTHVIIATPTHQLGFLDDNAFYREKQVLAAIRFDAGELWVHRDTRFMPRDREDWNALNYHMSHDYSHAMFTVWVNRVEPTLATAPPVFQTWNPLFEPTPDSVLSRTPLIRAVVHSGTGAALATLSSLHDEPGRRVFFTGSWAHPGVPLLESAVCSALAIADRFSIRPAWRPGT